ncbi:uncharacterized protein HaLaN_13200 [Haematococcus lacustris]|uniref:Uncharacterized protein n=1 Tax=Haematococcus lacustris TaxID=44745 RepID=A0A699Z3T0_HAELA|nr:uncharacterized protein HaLaN_13200 [Haematococcus lacustris]
MASTANVFDLLNGAESALRQKKKPAKPAAKTAGTADVVALVPDKAVVGVGEAVALFERTAREARSLSERCKLWKEWCRQAQDTSSKAPKYRDADGGEVAFSEALVSSRALEISLEAAVGTAFPSEREEALSQLIATFLPSAVQTGLSTALIRLSVLIENEAIDTRSAAQRAVYSIVSSLKSSSQPSSNDALGSAVSSWLGHLSQIEREITKQQALAHKLSTSNRGAVSKEQAAITKLVHSLYQQRFDLLQPGSIPCTTVDTSAASAGALKSLAELHNVVKSHLATASGVEESRESSGDATRAQTLASCKREEALLTQQAEQVASQVRVLEAQLRCVEHATQHCSLACVELLLQKPVVSNFVVTGHSVPSSRILRKSDLRFSRGCVWPWTLSMGREGARRCTHMLMSQASKLERLALYTPLQTVFSAAHYREELAVLESLSAAVDPSYADNSLSQQVLSVQAACSGAPLEYMASGLAYIQAASSLMGEMPAKIAYCKQRLVQAEKLTRLGGKDNTKMRDDAEKLLADTIKVAEDTLKSCHQVAHDMHTRAEAAARSAGHSMAVPETLGCVDSLLGEMQLQFEAVVVSHQHPSTPAPVPQQQPQTPPSTNSGASSAELTSASQAILQAAVSSVPVAVEAAQPVTLPPEPEAHVGNGHAPKTAFDAAAAYLASARPIAPKAATSIKAEQPNHQQRKATAAPVNVAAAKPWAKMTGANTTSSDIAAVHVLPTPSEAFKAPSSGSRAV